MLDRTVRSSDPEVLVDQLSNLSSTKETVLFLGFFCSSRLTFLLNWVLWKRSSHRVLQNSAREIPLIDDEDL